MRGDVLTFSKLYVSCYFSCIDVDFFAIEYVFESMLIVCSNTDTMYMLPNRFKPNTSANFDKLTDTSETKFWNI